MKEAIGIYESLVRAYPDSPRNDMVLLRLGLIHLKLGRSNREPERGEQFLRDLAERFPDSPLRDVSDYVLELLREARTRRADVERYREAAERLEAQLDALKRIGFFTDKRGDHNCIRFGELGNFVVFKLLGQISSFSCNVNRRNQRVSLAATEARFQAKYRGLFLYTSQALGDVSD